MSDLDKINSIFNAKIDSIKSKDELQNLIDHKINEIKNVEINEKLEKEICHKFK